MITSEQYSDHNIGRNHTSQKTKVMMTRLMMYHFQCFVSQKTKVRMTRFMMYHFQCFVPSSKLVIWTLWTCISGFESLGMTLTSTGYWRLGENCSNSRYLKQCTGKPVYKSCNIFSFSDEEVHCPVKYTI